jgi:ABC-type cobalamin/Fe3+-siderophores transport system ATPase subunit
VMMERGHLVAEGGPREVLTPERIADVFAVEATITDSAVGPIPVLRRPI